jgi:type I restriction enzyme M protein
VVLSKRKPSTRKDKIVLLNASRTVRKGKPKNYIPDDAIRPLAAAFLKGDPIPGELAVINRTEAEEADYNLSPSRWVSQAAAAQVGTVTSLLRDLVALDEESRGLSLSLMTLLGRVSDEPL